MIRSLHRDTGIDAPGLEPYKTLRRQQDHRDRGIFVAEGEKVVSRLIASELTILSVLMSPDWLEHYHDALHARPEPIDLFISSAHELSRIVGYEFHRGIMAVAAVPPDLSLDQIIASASSPLLLVALDNVLSAENVGVIVRSAAACGANALWVGENSADPYLRRAVRNSMGNIFRLPILTTASLEETVRSLRSRAFLVAAAHPHEQSTSIDACDFRGNTCIVLGNEDKGVSPSIVAACTAAVHIPMAPGVDSLNVACAATAIFCEVNRQRGMFRAPPL